MSFVFAAVIVCGTSIATDTRQCAATVYRDIPMTVAECRPGATLEADEAQLRVIGTGKFYMTETFSECTPMGSMPKTMAWLDSFMREGLGAETATITVKTLVGGEFVPYHPKPKKKGVTM